MANFELYFPHLLKLEGGYVNHPSDPGGETNWGITDRLDGKIDGKIDIDGDGKPDTTVKNLKSEEAKIIYKRLFWDKLKADDIKSQSVAEILFDFAVNSGVTLASKKIQYLVKVSQDGIIGNKTIEAINKLDPKSLFNSIKEIRIKYYKDIILNNPKLKIFEKGWMNRINSFKFKS